MSRGLFAFGRRRQIPAGTGASAVCQAAAMTWTKSAGDRWTKAPAEGGRFSIKVYPRGDGRWVWEVFAAGAVNPTATGIARNLGAAKSVSEQFVQRSG